MRYGIAAYGSVSSAGTTPAAAAAAYADAEITWRRDTATGLPVYPVAALPEVPALSAFADDREIDRAGLLALHAARQAVAGAGWEAENFTVLVGCSRGPTVSWEATHARHLSGEGLPVRTSPRTTLGSLAFAVGDYFGTTSPTAGLSVTCSSGLHALQHGMALLSAGFAGRVLVGGAEAPLTAYTLRQMEALRVYAAMPPPTLPACRPLAHPPSGMVLGEGAAFLAVEALHDGHACELLGIGAARERAGSATGISPDGDALQAAMRQARTMAGSDPDVVIAHAPGTARGDAAERTAIRAVFGHSLPLVTSLKWATGHTFGASGPLALADALEMLRTGKVYLPPYLDAPATRTPRRVMVNATGFGGNAVSVMVGLR
ncbi:beta-ketoacyl synthase N-terminal-like domain-containing protein [Lewinella sp. IMCC34183]|uniref:beta-ketoacyl synthase N-terminal-like domain-containing protein n=1 Tax=Lewinella sp. IMCC34183 TaxID=2248762 RepID=UPI000E254D26|nr:beta-ketoacyl synthase N-terminal-like domain-containing protein [Lewinella sp. IMCC34183]